jgi:hypothetical protein
VSAWRGVVAALVTATTVMACAAGNRATAGGLDDHSFLLFTGTDIWRYGGFLYGGFLWSPKGLDTEGFTFKTLLDGGAYSYVSGTLQQTVDGTKLSAAALPGWRFIRGGLNVAVYAGPVVQDYRLAPADPGSRLHGLYAGGEAAVDIWYQPSAMTMAAFNGAIASIGPTGYARGAIGVRVFDAAFVGPELEEIWCADFEELEVGAHLTALRIHRVEWSMASGLALTSDQRSGPYLRLGVNTRY